MSNGMKHDIYAEKTRVGREEVELTNQLEPARTELYLHGGMRITPLVHLLRRAAPHVAQEVSGASRPRPQRSSKYSHLCLLLL